MATVTNSITLPDGSIPARAVVQIRLVGATNGSVNGWVTATDEAVVSIVIPDVTNGSWSADLIPNAEISPSGTAYRVIEYVRGAKYTSYISVGSGGGTVHDLLVDAPSAPTSAALSTHAALTTGAHGIPDTSMLVAETAGGSSSTVLLAGASTNSINGSATASGVLGGTGPFPNTLSGEDPSLCWIIGGYDCDIAGVLANGIIVSHHSSIGASSTHGVIVGGSTLAIPGSVDYAAAVGGYNNQATANYAATIGGAGNVASGTNSVVLGGSASQAAGAHSLAAGLTCYAEGSGAAAIGYQNDAIGQGAAAVGGNNSNLGTTATTRGDYSGMLGGFQNNLGTSASARFGGVLGGRSHSVQSEYCGVVGGQEITLDTYTHQSAVGYRVSGKLYAAHHHAAGYFAAAGDAQHIRAVARATTTDANATIMYLDGSTQRLNIPASTTWMVEANIVARNTGADEHAAYVLRVCVKRDSTAASTSVLSSDLTALYETQAAWNVTATANTTNGALNINAVGEAGKTIRWVATVSITQVGG